MTKYHITTFILINYFGFGQKADYGSDTLRLTDEFNDVSYIVSSKDYFQEIKTTFPDSISRTIFSYITSIQDSISQGKRKDNSFDNLYYLSMDFYEVDPHGLTFDHVLYRLFVSGKLLLLKNEKYYDTKHAKIKVKRIYCCHNPFLYCGKDWFIFDKKKLLTKFSKSVTSKMYVIRSCF